MKKKRILAILLCLSLIFTIHMPNMYANADETNSGMVISKTATYNEEQDLYTIQLEAYATGSKIVTEVTNDIPTDIILVLDQSGSMSNSISTITFSPYEDVKGNFNTDYNTRNCDHYENRHNGGNENLYYSLGNGAYASVSVMMTSEAEFKTTTGTNSSYYTEQNNLYALIDGEYKKVTVSRSGSYFTGYTYTYSFEGSDGSVKSKGASSTPDFSNYTDDNKLYVLSVDETKNVYTYVYVDEDNIEHEIGSSVGAETTFEIVLYEKKSNSNTTRLNALKTAVSNFVEQVSEKAKGLDNQYGTDDDVTHRIAVVGFASNGSYSYKNTELLSTKTVINYNSATTTNYAEALVSINGDDGEVNDRITTAIDRLAADGDTYLEYGMDMANKIFAQYPISKDDSVGRQRIVVVFTDGYPAEHGTDNFNYSMANNAISNAYLTKNDYNATVYTVGVFDAADPTASITSGYVNNGSSSAQQAVAANRYMHYVSSNYPTAQSMANTYELSDKADPFNEGDSYYLSASDADSLNDIFQQISKQIEEGGASTTLSTKTVIKDVISPQFELPEKASEKSIVIETYSYIGENQWKLNEDAMGATASVSENTVSVTGFDFAKNYVGTISEDGAVVYRGNKIVIKFNVKPKVGFLGGNDVPTNAGAGIYEDKESEEPVLVFEQPIVNVPIGDVTVSAADKNVYLLGNLTGEQILSGSSVEVGDIKLDLNSENYGLEKWQYEYATISVEIKDENGNTITNLSNLDKDQTYSISVVVAPKTSKEDAKSTEGTLATQMDNTGSANVNVFKPVITYTDSIVYYGDTAPAIGDSNRTSVEWMHGDATTDGITLYGDEPSISTSGYTMSESMVDTAGKVAVKEDVTVEVGMIQIGETDIKTHTTIKRNPLSCGNDPESDGRKDFVVHVKTCDLNVIKDGGSEDETYVMTVNRNGKAYTTVTVNGNNNVWLKELPVGVYTIEEDTNWAWRYTASVTNNGELTAENPRGSVKCTNTVDNNKWINDSSVKVNTYATTNSTTGEGGE